ncbi:MAG: asparagine synthase (glutamine-hydrolyzing) [Propionivibrio sp.]|uniref:asparagine synthase (glutamine-hydrolyzing) n=1 Tax=Propionivibrio sp. TaxID=2212460 RepID=UPI0025FC6ACE|nr:asparagine synthase (glutamine-hydrolyzing) [Propionivibrio sp.]MBL0209037.1 asparagine synthase (glutamine-hydrolyzing) [Propionivibrio sp.]
MCGIAGLMTVSAANAAMDFGRIARHMADTLAHRGPDDAGVWFDRSGVALAHRRLAILDLTPAGHQPMISASGRFVLVFNGEIYNHLELRTSVEKSESAIWRGHSDTETLLTCFEVWGVEKTLRKSVGMFALALWDRQERTLMLARDRFGEKPLYYGWQGQSFFFASELKALAAYPGWQGEVDRDALALQMRYGYVPLPYSIWRNVRKLLPGSYLVLPMTTSALAEIPEPSFYWRARDMVNEGVRVDLDDRQATDELDALIRRTISGQAIADVPLGAFLSGGVDSSTVVALMQSQSERPIKTFTIGFTEKDYNEAEYAKAVASHLGTKHTELYVTPADVMAVVPRLAQMYDEPFSDVSQLPTHLVSAMARQHVTVSLSGDGGDELFGGYNRYFLGRSLWHGMRGIPVGFRRLASRCITSISPSRWDSFGRHLPYRFKQPMFGDRAHKLASLLAAKSMEDIYKWLVSYERQPELLVMMNGENALNYDTWAELEMRSLRCDDSSERMMFNDLVGYLTDDILCKVDRAAMAASLEVRVPFLDHRIAEFAWQLPLCMKIRDGKGKWLLRQVLYRYVPQALIERPKQGFGVPIDSWLRGPLRDWAEGLLDVSRLRREGFINPVLVHNKWHEHLSGRRNWQYWLWNILMFQAWHERWLGQR